MALSDNVRNTGTIVTTVAVFVLVLVWMIAVWVNLGKLPEYNDDGTVRIDEFQRAKDILSLVFPLATIAVGYWLGSEGKAKSDDKAKAAEAENTAIRTAVKESNDPEILTRAKAIFDEQFKS